MRTLTATTTRQFPGACVTRAIVVAALLFVPGTSFGGRDPEEWDDLPRFDSISFSETSVGFTAPDGQHYVLDRKTDQFGEVPAELFAQTFAGAIGAKAAEVREDPAIGTETG